MMGAIAVNTQHTGDPRRDHRGYAEPMTSEQVDSLLSEGWLRQMVADIRSGREALKDQLPYVCPHLQRLPQQPPCAEGYHPRGVHLHDVRRCGR